jgi:DNA-binding PadR family transcriptional regulator
LRRFLEPVLLLRLNDGPAHGYSLLDGLDEFGLGGLDPSMLYRVLREMEELGWVSSTWDEQETQGPPRRIYQLSPRGVEVLAEWTQDLERSKSRIERFLSIYRQQHKEGLE